MLSSPLQLCSPAGSSPSHRAFLSGPSPPPHALAFMPARLVSLSTSPCSSLAAAASLATVPMLLPFLAADDLRASACLRRLLFPAAARREASGIRRSPSSPIALAGQTSVPPRRAPLAAGRASLISWAPPRVLLPAASSGWLRVARPPILPCASAACPAIVRPLRPSPLVPGASRRRHARPSPAAPTDATSPRSALPIPAAGSSPSSSPLASSTARSGFAASSSASSSPDVSHASSFFCGLPSLVGVESLDALPTAPLITAAPALFRRAEHSHSASVSAPVSIYAIMPSSPHVSVRACGVSFSTRCHARPPFRPSVPSDGDSICAKCRPSRRALQRSPALA
ncbi:unnamed protein product [Closterium sp. NIES-65]|nr:unnamed protein product [Closterium sp. NIES-65]